MNRFRKLALALPICLSPGLALAQQGGLPAIELPPGTVIGNTQPVTAFGEAIPFSVLGPLVLQNGIPLTTGSIYIGGAANLGVQQPVSGDCTLSFSGVMICTKSNGTSFAPSATIDATNASNILSGSLPVGRLAGSYTGITGVGTIAAGVWNGTAIANANLANSATTVDGQTCTLGSTCTTTVASQSDYAATTWTPAITASGTAGTPAYTVQFGSYEKIGRQITLRGAVILSGWTGTPAGNITITGLPFANNATAGDGGRCYFSFWTVASSSGHITGEIAPSASVITVYNSSSTASTQLTAANTGTTPTLDFSCNYHI